MLTLLVMLQGLSGPAIDLNDPIIALLFSLVAASAHIIVPAAVFNLKVSLSFKRGRKSHDHLMLWVLLACQLTYTSRHQAGGCQHTHHCANSSTQSEGDCIFSKANIVGQNLVVTGDAGPVSDMCPVPFETAGKQSAGLPPCFCDQPPALVLKTSTCNMPLGCAQ